MGNNLSDHGYTSASIETLETFLWGEGFHVYDASSKKNKVSKMIEIILKTAKYAKKGNYVLIDTYSDKNF